MAFERPMGWSSWPWWLVGGEGATDGDVSGYELVRLDEDARHARLLAASEASGGHDQHPARDRLPLRDRLMRRRIMLAIVGVATGAVLLLAVPLAINLAALPRAGTRLARAGRHRRRARLRLQGARAIRWSSRHPPTTSPRYTAGAGDSAGRWLAGAEHGLRPSARSTRAGHGRERRRAPRRRRPVAGPRARCWRHPGLAVDSGARRARAEGAPDDRRRRRPDHRDRGSGGPRAHQAVDQADPRSRCGRGAHRGGPARGRPAAIRHRGARRASPTRSTTRWTTCRGARRARLQRRRLAPAAHAVGGPAARARGAPARGRRRRRLRQVDRLEATIDTLLAAARDGSADREPFAIAPLLEDVRRGWTGPLAAQGRALEIVASTGLPRARAAPGAVREALDVLVSAPRGTATVPCASRPGSPSLAIVADQGPGIGDPERAFERRSGEGHGIGLALARSLVEADGGRLDLADARPGMTRFTVLYRADSGHATGAERQ